MACSWALFWNHHLDLVGQDRQEEKNRKNWRTQTVRDRHRHQRNRGRQRQTERIRDRERYQRIQRNKARDRERELKVEREMQRQPRIQRQRQPVGGREGKQNRKGKTDPDAESAIEERNARPTGLGVSSQPCPHLELIPGVGMEAVPTAASQVRVGATQGLVRAAPADEAATIVVPG